MSVQSFDPSRHDTQLVAAFERRPLAEAARHALLGAGVPAEAIELLGGDPADPEPPSEGIFDTLRRLFAPPEDALRLGDAVSQGRTIVVVHPQGVSERETAIEVLEGCGPIDLEERDEPGHAELNHAPLTRADMAPNPLTTASDQPVAPTIAATTAETPPTGTTYTYGIPDTVARAMSAEEQILAQAPDVTTRPHFVRIVEERLRVGWREPTNRPTRVRSYLAERSPEAHRVELQEEEIGASHDRSGA